MTAMIEFFAIDVVIADLEAALVAATGFERLSLLVAMAWQIRQRDTEKALVLADEAQELLDQSRMNSSTNGMPNYEHRSNAARLMLVRGEADWLFARLDPALRRARDAMQEFLAIDHSEGRADAHWLLAMLAIDQGDSARRDAELEAMALSAARHDPVRSAIAEAALAFNATFADPVAAKANWGERFGQGKAGLHPAVGCWAEDFLGQYANLTSNFSQAVRHFSEVHALAIASGQTRRAIIAATNTGAGLVNLSDYHAALEWTQRGLDLARRTGWPGSIAICLQQTAATLRQLKRLDAARVMLHEALELMTPLAASRNYAITLWFLGEVELDSGAFATALKTYALMASRADALEQPDLQSYARCGQARALLELGQPEQALACANAARDLGKDSLGHQIEVLKILADIHARHELPPQSHPTTASMALHYLHMALDLSVGIVGLTIPDELLGAVSREYARMGDFRQAYDFGQKALAAREKTHNQEASNRAVAMQISQETERVRAEGESQRKLALAHAERLETLEM
jgi:tetratricopeptide (TPR) repeat protein